MNHFTEQFVQMRDTLRELAQDNAFNVEDLYIDLDYLAEGINNMEHTFLCALNEAEFERDHIDSMYNEVLERVEKLKAEKAQRADDEFRNVLITAAQGLAVFGHGDYVGVV